MSVNRTVIANEVDTEPLKLKCRNCMAFEEHSKFYWCDFWSTTIDDASTAYCSFFVPSYKPKESSNVSNN